jgi:MFS family permease
MRLVRRASWRAQSPVTRLVAAAATSSLGDGLVLVALPLLAVTLTTDPLLVSGLAVANGLPWLFVALPAGALVDRLDKRRLVTRMEIGRAALLALLAVGVLTGRIDLAGIYLVAFLIGVGETFVAAVTRSVVPQVVPDDRIPSTNGYVFAAETAGQRFAGPAVGGLIFGIAAWLPFFGDGASFAAHAVLLRSVIPEGAASPRHGVLDDLRSGLGWFLHHSQLRVLAIVVTTFAFCQAMSFAILVLYATRILHLDSGGYGLMLAAAALGNVIASFVAGRLHRGFGPFRTIAAAGIVAGCAYLAIGITGSAVLATLALFLEAAAETLGNVATLSARHRLIPPERFGLINNAFRTCVMGVVPVASIAGGALADLTSLQTTFLAAGAVQLLGLAAIVVPLRTISLGAAGQVPAGQAAAAAVPAEEPVVEP